MPTTPTTAVEEEEEEEGTNERTVKKNHNDQRIEMATAEKGTKKHPEAAEKSLLIRPRRRGATKHASSKTGGLGNHSFCDSKIKPFGAGKIPVHFLRWCAPPRKSFLRRPFAVLDPDTSTFFQFENHLLFPSPAARKEIQ